MTERTGTDIYIPFAFQNHSQISGEQGIERNSAFRGSVTDEGRKWREEGSQLGGEEEGPAPVPFGKWVQEGAQEKQCPPGAAGAQELEASDAIEMG